MASESNFTGFGDPSTNIIAADLYMGSPRNLNFFVLEDEPLSHDTSGPHLSPHSPPFFSGEYPPAFFLGIPPDAPPTLGVTHNFFHSLQAPHEISILQSHTTLPTASRNEGTGTELLLDRLTPSPSGVLPIFSLSVPSPPPVTAPPLNWIKVPQRDYDHGRRQWDFERSDPISFSVNGHLGVSMGDALRKEFTGLDGRDDPVLQEAAGAISCRLLFPGYPANSSSCQIHVLDWTKDRLPITRSKLAHEVAKQVERYLNCIAKLTLDGFVKDRWKVGEGFMHIDNMFLVHLVSVSKGSFQPEIWVVDPSAPQVFASWE